MEPLSLITALMSPEGTNNFLLNCKDRGNILVGKGQEMAKLLIIISPSPRLEIMKQVLYVHACVCPSVSVSHSFL